ncbi:MAG: prepilin-type N-terminal cleavage/methylation domain-containing protein [Acidobacteria bacterium]|nr:MAG: prepilin-type N-terminal cleavage/methylation domain-containing protein [Acidobacteriota bacterium]
MMCDLEPRSPCVEIEIENARGFTLIEVLISIFITLIVMASVFALLTRGQRSFQREPEIADLQQNARNVLDMVSRDILQTGAGLPPEFPAFSRQNGAGDGAPTDSIEMIGAMQLPGQAYLDAENVANFTGGFIEVTSAETNFLADEIVVLYNDAPNDAPAGSQWAMLRVKTAQDNVPSAIDGVPRGLIEVDYVEFAAYSNYLGVLQNSAELQQADMAAFQGTTRPKLTRVSVVRYFTQLDNPADYVGPPPQLVMRSVDFAPAQPVGYLEDFQIAYTIGVTAPFDQDNPPDPIQDLVAGTLLTAENMLSVVRITVTARSITAGLEGASEGASAGREDDFIRKTFSTNVNPRNLSAALEVRAMALAE